MSDWSPKFFEEEMLAIQPDCDFVNDHYAPATLIGNYRGNLYDSFDGDNEYVTCDDTAQKYADDDCEDDIEKRERETITMMRNLGIDSSIDGKLDSKNTLPTPKNTLPVIYQGKRPILLDECFFQLRPRQNVDLDSMNSTTTECLSSGSSTDVSLGKSIRIFESSSPKTDSNSSATYSKSSTEKQSPLDKILGIDRNKMSVNYQPQEESDENVLNIKEYPQLPARIEHFNHQKVFCTPKELYMKKSKMQRL